MARIARKRPTRRRAASGFWVLAADTIVVLEGQVFGKPADLDNARQMLTTLSGHPHQVMTAFVLLDPTGKTTAAEIVTSQVTFKELSESEVTAYLATGEPLTRPAPMPFKARGAISLLRSPAHTPTLSAYQWTRSQPPSARLVCSQRSLSIRKGSWMI